MALLIERIVQGSKDGDEAETLMCIGIGVIEMAKYMGTAEPFENLGPQTMSPLNLQGLLRANKQFHNFLIESSAQATSHHVHIDQKVH
jgi:hypothetical protein